MTLPNIIYANLSMSPIDHNEAILSGTLQLEACEIAATQPYILATPEALAASPEVQALVKAAYDDALRVIGEGQELTVTGDGRDDDWRYRARVARADALNNAMAKVMLARDAALRGETP